MKTEQEQLISVIRARMRGEEMPRPDPACLQTLMQLAKAHKLGPFVYQWLLQYPETESALETVQAMAHHAIFRDTQFDYIRSGITQALTKLQIPHVFMRGVCLKEDYPDPTLRTMSDMDILVKPSDFPAIRKAMLAMDAVACNGDGNHRIYQFPEGVLVEFHPNLIHCSSPVGTLANPGWQYVPEGQPPAEQVMTPEGFYVNVMAHLANHFVGGGIGVRFVLDIWVCRHLRNPQPDRHLVEQELERIGLLDFARNIEALSEWWFSGAPGSELLETMADYIFTSGSHGEERRAMLNAVCLSPGKSSGSALWHKIFYPRQDLETRFDWVIGRPWLLPVAWLARVYKALTGRWKRIFHWSRGTQSFTQDEITRQRTLLKEFGIK